MKRYFGFLLASCLLLPAIPAVAQVSHIFVSNSGDDTLSLLQCVVSEGKQAIRCEERERMDVGFNNAWPANQYQGHPAWWWTGLSGEVVGLKAKASLQPLNSPQNVKFVDTYVIPGRPNSGSNFIGVSPHKLTAWNSAREVDRIQEIDVNPDSPTFGTILTSLTVPDLDPTTPATATRGAARPCDATMTPDGRYFVEPDLGGESVTFVDTEAGVILWQVASPPANPDEKVMPFMATTNGDIALIENLEAPSGTYDVFDVSVLPNQPIHLKKIGPADGLGNSPQTSEFTPNGRYAYLIINGLADDGTLPEEERGRIDVLDVDRTSATFLEIVNRIELPTNCRPHAGDFTTDGGYFVLNCSGRDQVAVINNASQTVVETVAVGPSPRGVIVR
jgi:hypothetical protein